MSDVRAILTDIEGTTSSLAFVHDVLFPYARVRIGDYLRAHHDDAGVRQQLAAVEAEVGRTLDLEAAITELERWIDEDRKATPLKALQGLLWETGYREGDYTGHVYPDAVKCLRAWHDNGLRLYVFSSGSVHAQKLLFGYSDAGDLTPLFSGYFDTTTGNKREAESYRRIAEAIGEDPGAILFLSDIVEELDAAREAGMRTCQLAREGQPTTDRHPVATDFDEVNQ